MTIRVELLTKVILFISLELYPSRNLSSGFFCPHKIEGTEILRASEGVMGF